jgi:hypothetical protein
MKKLLMRLVLILFLGATNLVLAQSTSPSNTKNPKAHALHKRLRQKMRQVQADLKSGKITQTQANSKRENLMAVHQEEMQLKKQNGSHELTDDQAQHLNSELDKN